MKPHPSPATLGPMTDLASVPGGAPPATGHRTGGVSVRELHSMGELERVDRLLLSIWSSEDQQPPVSAHMLRALSHSGAYVAGAFDDDGDLVGACVGFFGPPQDRSLHSHIAGVAPRAQGRNVGFLLKSHQHGWARALGVREVTWTFDPLVRRNAYFNLAKLGALPTAYLPDFYGEMVDGINAGQGSDRLYLAWDTTAPVSPRLVTDVEGATAVLTVSPDQRPVVTDAGSAARLLVGVPEDIEGLRAVDPELGRSWRAALREVLGGLLADGAAVTGFTREGQYVVTRSKR